jgi:hypothetical protein
MSVRAAADKVHDALSQALMAGKIPASSIETGETLLKRLRQPVRVTLMGLPGSGKSTLTNLLLNDIVIPKGISLPTTQYVHGESPEATLTLTDGRTETLAGADPFEIAAASPMYVEVALPLAALGRINVLEIVAPATLQDQQRAMHWAAKRTDVAIWCTQHFDRSEQALWDTMPDAMKDSGFLLLTHADEALARGQLDQTLAHVRQNFAYQFNKIMPIATPSAIAARQPDGTVDKPMMQKSGGLTLISSILRQVDMSLQGTVDQAELMVKTHKDAPATNKKARPAVSKPIPIDATAVEAAPTTPEPKVETPVPQVPTPAPVVAEIDSTNVVEMKTAKQVDAATTKPAPRPRAQSTLVAVENNEPPATPVAEAPKKTRPGFMPKARSAAIIPRAKPETCEAYLEAISYLTKQGRTLTQNVANDAELSSNDLMNASAENIMWVSDFLEDLTIKDDPVLEKTRTRALDAAELVQLMQIEKNESAALDALSLVIQLKRDLEAEIALSRHNSRNQAA